MQKTKQYTEFKTGHLYAKRGE